MGGAVAAADPVTQQATVTWHPQSGQSGVVPGASAELTRTDTGISFSFNATQLQAGHAYTVWLVIINNTAACAAQPCAAPDLLGNAGPDAQVVYATGQVIGESGAGTFEASRDVGPILEGWLADRGLTNPHGAEVQLVLNDHGPEIAEFMPAMIETYRAGCTDESLPTIFPETAFADGEPGPNTCVLTQVAVFPGSSVPSTAMDPPHGGMGLATLVGLSLISLSALVTIRRLKWTSSAHAQPRS